MKARTKQIDPGLLYELKRYNETDSQSKLVFKFHYCNYYYQCDTDRCPDRGPKRSD